MTVLLFRVRLTRSQNASSTMRQECCQTAVLKATYLDSATLITQLHAHN
jgi:hypothetical protein